MSNVDDMGERRKTCRNGPWGRVQNKTDNPASVGLSDREQ